MRRRKRPFRLSRSVRVHIRRQKASIRRRVADPEERSRLIAELCGRFRSGQSA